MWRLGREKVVLTFAHPSEEKGLNWEGVGGPKGSGRAFRKTLQINLTKVIAGLKITLTFALPSARKGKKRIGNRKITGAGKGHK